MTKIKFVNIHKKSPSIEGDNISFSDGDFYFIGLNGASKAVIPHELAYTLIFPSFSCFVLISQSVILGEGERKIILKTTIGGHGIVRGLLIVAGMFSLSPCKVVGRSYFKDINAVRISIMPYIQKLFYRILSPLFYKRGDNSPLILSACVSVQGLARNYHHQS